MTKKTFAQLATENMLFLDGATGSNLMKAGMPSGVCPEEWILQHKDILIKLQKEYIEAGSNIIYAPTFSANRIKLEEYGLYQQQETMIHSLVSLSKEAANSKAFIAGDLTMTGEQLHPIGTLTFEELISVYKEQINYMVHSGVDLLVVETMMSLQETRAAVIAAKEVCDLPILATLTFESDGRTLFGTDATTAAVVLSSLGVDGIGANCSTGPDKMVEVIRSMARVTSLPIIAKPNAGLPFVNKQGETCYDMSSEDFAVNMGLLVDAGATILGGCCGTTPEYIRQLKEMYKSVKPTSIPREKINGFRFLASERQTLSFSLDQNFMVVGERINPTGKKKLQEQLRAGLFDMVADFAEEQTACGAHILDVNMGMSGIDEKQTMLTAIEEIASVTHLPLSIDSSHVDVIEAALRQYPGRALINSISLEKDKCDNLLPLAKKYGAMFIILPVSDKGLPANVEEKFEIIQTIYDKGLSIGLSIEDMVVDGLVATVGANPMAALETLETIKRCKDIGFATICGLSNISFGMPERSFVNSTFLTMAIQNGLTMAIANPSQELLMGAALASDLLLAREEGDIRYIEFANKVKANRPQKEVVQTTTSNKSSSPNASVVNETTWGTIRDSLKDAVLKGNRKGIAGITKQALAEGEDPKLLLDEVLLPAINLVGDYFDKGTYFLPQLISSAEAMKLSIEILEPLMLEQSNAENMPVVIMATVEGDIHDIGKNLVSLMLKNYGFKVIDLGKDVKKEVIVQAAIEHRADIIGLSALMTTTMQRMREVIIYAREQGVTAHIIIGGAVITQEYADEINADGYSEDASKAVQLAKRLLGILNHS